MRTAFCALIAMAIVFCGELRADTIIQSSGESSLSVAPFDPLAQSFLLTTGTGLGSIGFTFTNQIPTSPNEAITVTLYAGVGFSGSVLGSVTQLLTESLPSPFQPGLPVDFDFSGVALAPGLYTAAVTTISSPRVGLKFATNNPYADGAMFYTGLLPPGACTSSGANCDLQFRVLPASVPETSSLILLALGSLLASTKTRSIIK